MRTRSEWFLGNRGGSLELAGTCAGCHQYFGGSTNDLNQHHVGISSNSTMLLMFQQHHQYHHLAQHEQHQQHIHHQHQTREQLQCMDMDMPTDEQTLSVLMDTNFPPISGTYENQAIANLSTITSSSHNSSHAFLYNSNENLSCNKSVDCFNNNGSDDEILICSNNISINDTQTTLPKSQLTSISSTSSSSSSSAALLMHGNRRITNLRLSTEEVDYVITATARRTRNVDRNRIRNITNSRTQQRQPSTLASIVIAILDFLF